VSPADPHKESGTSQLEGVGRQTMKRKISRMSEEEIGKSFPIDNRVSGWFFRVDEISAGTYLAEGRDLWGREVSSNGPDPDRVLEQCIAAARSIIEEDI